MEMFMSDNLIMDMFCFWKLPGKSWKLVWNDLTTEFRLQKMIPSKTHDLFEKQAPIQLDESLLGLSSDPRR